jgi:hypothetical protein
MLCASGRIPMSFSSTTTCSRRRSGVNGSDGADQKSAPFLLHWTAVDPIIGLGVWPVNELTMKVTGKCNTPEVEGSGLSPERTRENSPALQRWDNPVIVVVPWSGERSSAEARFQGKRNSLRAFCRWITAWVVFLGMGAAASKAGAGEQGASAPAPARSAPSQQVYRVHWLPGAKIKIDGRADEAAWRQAAVEKHFVFPWKRGPAPKTEFRALCDETNFYFSFQARDADLVVLETLRDKEDEVFEDRVEMFLSLDDQMHDYFCLELDSRGRVLDYRASFYRQFDRKWKLAGLESKAASLPGGYEVEGRIPLRSLTALGFPLLRPGVKIRCGLFRAEFSHDLSGRPVVKQESIHNLGRKLDGPPPIEAWMSWVDPKTKEPDFHVPASLGWLTFVR